MQDRCASRAVRQQQRLGHPRLAVAALVGFWGLLAYWQYRRSPRGHEDKAWRGAGASVLLATAAWVALLFTTSTVVASANWLNGPDHGVGDLVSQVEVPDKSEVAPTMLDLDSEQSTDELRRHRRHHPRRRPGGRRGHGRVTVSSGTIEMKGLSLKVDARLRRHAAPSPRAAAAPSLRESVLAHRADRHAHARGQLPERAGASKCTAEDSQFQPAGVLTLPSRAAPVVLTLGKGVVLDPSDDPEVPLAVPQVLIWTRHRPAALAAARRARSSGWPAPVSAGDVGSGDQRALRARRGLAGGGPRTRPRPVRRGPSYAALAHRAETLLDVVGAITSPVALVIVVISMCRRPAVGAARPRLDPHRRDRVDVAGRRHVRRPDRPRLADPALGEGPQGVGVIWDLTTFWPRAAHPLAPPCYAERVIPELQIRSRWVLDRHGRRCTSANRLILSGHSQGSLIVLATVSRLDQDAAAAHTDDHLRQPDPRALRPHLPARLRAGRRRLPGTDGTASPSTTRSPTCPRPDGVPVPRRPGDPGREHLPRTARRRRWRVGEPVPSYGPARLARLLRRRQRARPAGARGAPPRASATRARR